MLVLFALLIGSASVIPPDTVYALPEMTVTATRFEARAAELGHRVQRIDAESIERSGSRNVADALSRNGGVYVRKYGASGMASLSLRGSGASQTSILLDGRRLSDPQLGQLDLTLLPIDALSAVEILHGSASAIHGSDGIGGAINLRTRPPADGLQGAASFGAGDFGERAVSGWISAGKGPAGFLLSGRLETAENDYPYYSRALGEEVRVQGADREQASLFASARYATQNTAARLSGLMTTTERGLPAGSGLPSRERQDDDVARMWADVTHAIPGGEVRFGGLIQAGSLRYRNSLLGVDDTGETYVATVDAHLNRRIGVWSILGGVEVGRSSASHPSIADNRREYRQSAFGQAQGLLGTVRLYPALRIDRYDVQDEVRMAVSPSLAANASLSPTTPFLARASVGQSFRMPTFNDRFWTPGGNPDLRPERGWSSDVGIILDADHVRADVGVFWMEVRDQIVWNPTSSGFWSPKNVARTRAMGGEISAQLSAEAAGRPLSVDASYRFTDVRDRSTPGSVSYNQPLRYRPRHTFSALAASDIRGVDASLILTGTGRVYTTDDRSRWLNPVVVASARFAFPIVIATSTIRISAEVENIFDRQYSVVENRPMPPRHIRVGLQINTASL